jgi:hypothetical protein
MGSPQTVSVDKDIRQELDIQNLLARMPTAVADSFSDIQLVHLKTAIGSRNWAKHSLDLRGTITFPFTRWRYYYVFLAGRNRRQLSEREQKISALMTAFILLIIISASIGLGLLCLYLLKSFSGIDIFPGLSLGIWDYFKTL